MNNSVEKTGKNIEEALKAALEELENSKEEVDVEVLDEGSRGVLGLIGSKMKIRVTRRRTTDKGKNFVEEVVCKMGLNADVEVRMKTVPLLR